MRRILLLAVVLAAAGSAVAFAAVTTVPTSLTVDHIAVTDDDAVIVGGQVEFGDSEYAELCGLFTVVGLGKGVHGSREWLDFDIPSFASLRYGLQSPDGTDDGEGHYFVKVQRARFTLGRPGGGGRDRVVCDPARTRVDLP